MNKKQHSGRTKIGPHYTLIIPFNSSMVHSESLKELLKAAGKNAEEEINFKYAKVNADFLIKALHKVILGIQTVPKEKTIAIFISRHAKKVYFFTPTKKLLMPPLHPRNFK